MYKGGTKIVPYFFHFAQCLWRKAGKLGLRRKDYLKSTKDMILNLKTLPFIDINDIEERFSLIYQHFHKEEKIFKDFLDYVDKNWIKSQKYKKELWNYSKGVIKIISKSTKFNNIIN